MPRPAAIVLAGVVLVAVLAPVLAPYGPNTQLDVVTLKNAAPSLAHWLGTDQSSRDVLSRAMFGARTSLTVAFLATFLATLFGCLWGGIAATLDSPAGRAMMLGVDVVRSVPRILLFLVAMWLLGTVSSPLLALVLGLSAWPATSRLVYVFVRDMGQREFVAAARSLGATPLRVLTHHLAPHLIGPLTASGALLLADCMAVESGLSYLGFGVKVPQASWGNMIKDALGAGGTVGWRALVPCVCLVTTVLAAASLADAAHAHRSSSQVR